jgi:hypothetical protein
MGFGVGMFLLIAFMVWIRRQVSDCRRTGFGNAVRQLIC